MCEAVEKMTISLEPTWFQGFFSEKTKLGVNVGKHFQGVTFIFALIGTTFVLLFGIIENISALINYL